MPRKYSSVSEAFEGGDGGGGGDDEDEDAVEEGDVEEGDGDEMLLVTDEPPQAFKPTLSW
ncbi:chromo domain-containing protein [Colletotrichum higginsianum]|nr:chromo domain-containing protein [Colletotrichum higginsianum]